ncbi:MAG: hypothetical protein K2G28_11035, partial [Acetatifactor sp.]|nr:hypothetical protein [Acetatifactor sp.]
HCNCVISRLFQKLLVTVAVHIVYELFEVMLMFEKAITSSAGPGNRPGWRQYKTAVKAEILQNLCLNLPCT